MLEAYARRALADLFLYRNANTGADALRYLRSIRVSLQCITNILEGRQP